MRKTIIFSAFAALAMISSCQKEAATEQKSDELTFTASIVDQSTRTTIDTDESSATRGKVSWEVGDEITISDGTNEAVYYIKSESDIAADGTASFTYKGGDRLSSSAESYHATYGCYGEPISDSQEYSATMGKLPMYGESDPDVKTKLNFTVGCGILKLNLTAAEGENDKTISKIEVSRDADDEFNLFTLTCDNVSIASAMDFCIAVPPTGDLVSIKFTNSTGHFCYRTAKEPLALEENKIQPVTITGLVFDDKVPGKYVDLGLSVKWATFNVGASKPEEYGKYFAWGDVVGQTWDESSFSSGGFYSYLEYELDTNGNITLKYDAAHVNWGGIWRMPTKAEQQELINNCTSTRTDDYEGTGVAGFIFTSKTNGNSIFLPTAGYGYRSALYFAGSSGRYWSSTVSDNGHAWYLYFRNFAYTYSDYRSVGLSVRPVYGEYIPVTSISLSETNIGLTPESSRQLITAAHQPENASLFTLSWSSSNKAVATVSADGLVTAVGEGKCTITASVGTIKAECTVTVVEPEYVDLGLSVKWATFNVGASKPEDYGRYFAWGDVVGQTWNGSSWSGGGFSDYPEYKLDANGDLNPEYDAAYVNWGGMWRMPTYAEQEELTDNCTSTWTSNYNGTGVAGRIFTSNKEGYMDKSIFLPAAGLGCNSSLSYAGFGGGCWSGTFGYGNDALYLYFISDDVGTGGNERYYGFSVRPVYCGKSGSAAQMDLLGDDSDNWR